MFIHYKVNYWDEVDFKPMDSQGITSGKDIKEALGYICEYYGEKNISSVTLDYELGDEFTLNDDCTLLIMDN